MWDIHYKMWLHRHIDCYVVDVIARENYNFRHTSLSVALETPTSVAPSGWNWYDWRETPSTAVRLPGRKDQL